MSKKSLTIDLHPIYNQGDKIDTALEEAIEEAEDKKLTEIEIICGKGSGQLKKRVLRFLDRSDVKQKYHRVKKDFKNHGRVFVYFRWKGPGKQ
ncbi:MAG: Smr/MutS family protein [Dehalococcoidia bacterium]